jgi:hypothetical protein
MKKWTSSFIQSGSSIQKRNLVADWFCDCLGIYTQDIADLSDFVKENLTFTGEDSPMSNLLLSVMGAFAQFERADPRAPVRRDCDRRAGREVQRQETGFDARARPNCGGLY